MRAGSTSTFNSYVTVHGEGPPVVLIHGVGLDLVMWEDVVHALANTFQVWRYDLIGHGHTPNFQGKLTFQELMKQLEDILTEHQIDSAAIVGFSLGALIAQAFTLTHQQKVRKLVLLNSVYLRNSEQQAAIQSRLNQVKKNGIASNIEASISRWFTERFRREHPEQIRIVEERLRQNDFKGFLAAYRLFAQSDAEFKDKLHQIKIPTLVITGSDDIGSTPEMSHAIASQIVDAEVKIFANVKHMLPVENADKLANVLIRFLSEDDNG